LKFFLDFMFSLLCRLRIIFLLNSTRNNFRFFFSEDEQNLKKKKFVFSLKELVGEF
jgi:hypothetical protein